MKAGQMHAALRRVDVVDEAVLVDVIGVVVLHCHFDIDVVLRPVEVQDVGIERGLVLVQVLHILPDAALVVEHVLPHLGDLSAGHCGIIHPQVLQTDAKALCQKRHLPESLQDNAVVKDRGLLKDSRIRQERDRGSRLLLRAGADLMELLLGLSAILKADAPDTAALLYRHLQPGGEGIHNRGADAVQAAGDFIAPAAELSAGVQDGIDHLHGGLSGLVVDADGNASAVVRDRDGIVRIDGDLDMGAESRQRLIHRVIDDLIDQMVEPSGGGGADVHAGALADCLQALEDLNVIRRVGTHIPGILHVVIFVLPLVFLELLHKAGMGIRRSPGFALLCFQEIFLFLFCHNYSTSFAWFSCSA